MKTIEKSKNGTVIEKCDDTGATLKILRTVALNKVKPVFEGCTRDELEYYLLRAIEQEEYELCHHIKMLLDEMHG